jgi:MFS superfamily sulfate permease-like transporter
MTRYVRSVLYSFPTYITPTIFRDPLPRNREQMRSDLLAGLTVAIVLIPHS